MMDVELINRARNANLLEYLGQTVINFSSQANMNTGL